MSEIIRLPHKPDTPLSYRFLPGQGPLSTTHLVVFLNGLIVSQAGWELTIEHLQKRWTEHSRGTSYPSLLTYDRYGQGESSRDPTDEQNGGVHDIREVVRDLHALVQYIWETKTRNIQNRSGVEQAKEAPQPKLVFVSNSIGCVIARLYTETYPGIVEGLLLLDSNIANSDLVSVFPDPDAPGFDPKVLPSDATVEELRRTRAAYDSYFRPSVPNPEHLDRRNIADLLPLSDAPPLQGPGSIGPWITVVGHDWETFAEEGEKGFMNVPKSLTNTFLNPEWSRYNEGLVRLTQPERARGPVIATGCGHFIQRDDPAFVAELTENLLEKVKAGTTR
ncbi:alpha/beta-hydrolase [Hypoxylon trugodes]|uniref:alpha/beta-hydrolase n=1 Tax=Hypoxylon trugodes TaxID=326681 RepID=UPI0021A0CED9|nr:alpha/beta-hydrolase [Hypoxylon trugodes]KAI1393950.1 alpha/beta-hydrolase [Hypoxylon trugodes]